MITTLFALIMSVAGATESWFCTTESSRTEGDKMYSCGVGTAKDEETARAKAFKNAHAEFKLVCDAATSCRGHAVNVEPKRTTCDKFGSGYKCHRLIVFQVFTDMEKAIRAKDIARSNESDLDKLTRQITQNLLGRPTLDAVP